jgi:hypothetical protein
MSGNRFGMNGCQLTSFGKHGSGIQSKRMPTHSASTRGFITKILPPTTIGDIEKFILSSDLNSTPNTSPESPSSLLKQQNQQS